MGFELTIDGVLRQVGYSISTLKMEKRSFVAFNECMERANYQSDEADIKLLRIKAVGFLQAIDENVENYERFLNPNTEREKELQKRSVLIKNMLFEALYFSENCLSSKNSDVALQEMSTNNINLYLRYIENVKGSSVLLKNERVKRISQICVSKTSVNERYISLDAKKNNDKSVSENITVK